MISWTCDLHMLSLILVNACFAAFGAKGGMDHIHVLQLGYKFGYVCHQNWPKYKALLQHYFPDQSTRMKKPQMLVETRWLYVLHNMATLLAHGVKKNDIIRFGMAMIQTLESTVMDRRIWGQIVEWLQIPEIQVAIFFIVEFGDTFLLEQFYRSEQADAEFELGEGFRLHRMPLTALERLLQLEAMAVDVLSAFPQTKSAMLQYFTDTDGAATAKFTSKMEMFVQKAIVTLLNNSVRRAWDPHLLFALLGEKLVDREMAHFLLTDVFQDTMQCSFEERKDDDYASLLWTTLKGRVLIGTVAEDMRQAWTASWGQSLGATGYIEELRLIRDGGACIVSSRLADLSNSVHGTQLAVPCSLWLNMFKCTYLSGPHTSQTGECIFKKLDDLKTGSTSVSDKHLSQRLLHAMNNVGQNQAYRKKLAAARAAEKKKLKASIEAVETEDKVERRLRQTDANSKAAVTFALAQCKLHYTTEKMAELRKRYRPTKNRTDDAEGQVYVDRYMEQEKKYKDKKRTRNEEEILTSAQGRTLELWSERGGKWNMEVAMELIMQELEMVKAPVGGNGKKMTAAERDEWVQVTFDSEEFNEEMRESLRERILKGTAAKKVAKQEAKERKQSGGAEGSAAKPEKKRAKKAAVEPEPQ